jgi:2-iminobutanoate/2-iminopropanoate deaminase
MSLQSIDGHASAGRPYVPGIASGDLIFVSGQIPIRDGRIVDESIEAQIEVVLENIESILGHAGASLKDVVRCGVYVADLATSSVGDGQLAF